MDYHPGVFVLGRRDVIAAWIVLAVVGLGAMFIGPGASAGDASALAETQARHRSPVSTPHNALCSNTMTTPANRHG